MALHVRRASGLALALVALLLAGFAARAAADVEAGPEGFAVRMLNAEGGREDRAGAHPDRLEIEFGPREGGTPAVEDLAIEMPAGFGGDPNAVPACPRRAHEEGEECPADTQVGMLAFGSGGIGSTLPLFRLETAPGQMSTLTSKPGIEIPFKMKLRPDDFGITLEGNELGAAPNEARIELWGVPANHQEAPSTPPRAFLTTPTVCGPLIFTLRTRASAGAPWLSTNAEAGPLVGCESLSFAPRLSLRLSNPVADSPTGVRMALSMPEEGEGDELANAQIKDVAIEMPAGLTISPGAAAGLAICTDAQLALHSEAEASCPAASRVGTIELSSASLPEPLSGSVYLGQQQGDERVRLFVAVPAPGTVLKFVAGMQPSSAGGLSATMHLPQTAIDRIVLSLDGGPSGLLATPLGCGQVRGIARFVPYGDGPAVTSIAPVAVASLLPGLSCPGPLPFSPQLLISASSHKAGKASSFSATLRRRGGEALPAQFTMVMPAGLSAGLGTVEACPEALADSGNCPASSLVGSASAEVGSGSSLATLNGSAYLAGPYRRGPFSLVLAFHGAVGPFDLGTFAFRAAAQIDKRTGRVAVSTDRMPSEVEGMSIRFREIRFALDRPGLVRNPTSCGPHPMDVTVQSEEGVVVALSSPYQVTGCRRLGFAPKMRMTLAGRGALHRHSRVALRVSARFRRGDAGLRSLDLSLPPALSLDPGGLEEICSETDARRRLCPAGSRVGTATARTPLLSGALRGSMYVVQPHDDEGEPDIWVILSGDDISLAIRGNGAREHGRFVTKLGGLPDMPLSSLAMRLGAVGKGFLSLQASPCVGGHPRRLLAHFKATAQNGKRRDSELRVATGARC